MYADDKITDFTDKLASKAPVPGGGGAAALVLSLSAALLRMVGNISRGKKSLSEFDDEFSDIEEKLRGLQAKILLMIDEDAESFMPLAAAYRLPKNTKEEKAERGKKIEEGLSTAAEAPEKLLILCKEILRYLKRLSETGSRTVISDAGVAAAFTAAAARSAFLNVCVNTSFMKKRDGAEKLEKACEKLASEIENSADKIYKDVFRRIKEK